MLSPQQFEIRPNHIKLMERLYFREGEYAPEIDAKRPYGNSWAPVDVAEILGWEIDEDGLTQKQFADVRKIALSMAIALDILMANVQTGIQPGIYVNHGDQYRADWKVRP